MTWLGKRVEGERNIKSEKRDVGCGCKESVVGTGGSWRGEKKDEKVKHGTRGKQKEQEEEMKN
jgi:hypothetical protein